ncbi:MAG: HRDC domain-containing protein, partial [Candidatus Methylomirabilales bacterium]
AREALALTRDRPPFMVLGNESLVRLARERPRDAAGILAIPGCGPSVVRRSGEAIREAITRGEAVPEAELPVLPPPPRPVIPPPGQRRAEALRAWRVGASERLGLEPGLLLPQRLIDRLAAEPPADLTALTRVDGVRRWRAELFGGELLRALATAH